MGANLKFVDFKIIADGGRATDDGDAPTLILAQAQNQLADKVVKLDRPSPLKMGIGRGWDFIKSCWADRKQHHFCQDRNNSPWPEPTYQMG